MSYPAYSIFPTCKQISKCGDPPNNSTGINFNGFSKCLCLILSPKPLNQLKRNPLRWLLFIFASLWDRTATTTPRLPVFWDWRCWWWLLQRRGREWGDHRPPAACSNLLKVHYSRENIYEIYFSTLEHETWTNVNHCQMSHYYRPCIWSSV